MYPNNFSISAIIVAFEDEIFFKSFFRIFGKLGKNILT